MILSRLFITGFLLFVLFVNNSIHSFDNICWLPPVFPKDFLSLTKQDKALIRDLKLINYPPEAWKIERNGCSELPFYDVAIVGGGMAGLTAGAALFKEGIFNIKIFDENSAGLEGPWCTYARMKTLRSSKNLMGPALEVPHLTFHAWFEAQWGNEAWKKMHKIPNGLWMDYLNWYRKVLQLPIENEMKLMAIIPMQDCLELEFQKGKESFIVKAHKVILATGRMGFGGVHIPEVVKKVPKSFYAHTSELINFENLKNRRIGIIGVGASAFDAAAVALESGAASVDILMRRQHLPNVNKFASLPYKGFTLGYYKLSDEKKWEFMSAAFASGISPPIEALHRIQKDKNFHLRVGSKISSIEVNESELIVRTDQNQYTYDFLILGTGFCVDGSQQPEFRHIIDQIALWKDRLSEEVVQTHPFFGNFPYLGSSFEFLPKETGTAPYLKRLYCFNYAATLSHGLLSSDIPGISTGATRLAQGIAADFFLDDSDFYLERLKGFNEEEFDRKSFDFP